MRKFDDIEVSADFIKDYENLPKPIKKRVDRRINDWALVGELPLAAQAHRIHGTDDRWILYLTVSSGAYRIIGQIKDRKLMLHRVADHEVIDLAIKNLTRL